MCIYIYIHIYIYIYMYTHMYTYLCHDTLFRVLNICVKMPKAQSNEVIEDRGSREKEDK